jgi:hypothetical protein
VSHHAWPELFFISVILIDRYWCLTVVLICISLLTNDIELFLVGLGLEVRASHLQTGAPPLKPQLQSILLWLFWRWGLVNYLLRLASNCDPPDLSLLSS